MTPWPPSASSLPGMAVTGDRSHDRPGRRGRRLLELAIWVALLAFALPVTLRSDEAGAGTWIDSLLLPAVVLPVLWRRSHPLAAAAALVAGCVVSALPTFEQFRLVVAIPAGMLIVFSVALREDRGRALAGLALVLAAMAFVGLTESVLDEQGGAAGMIAFTFPLCIATWGAGRVVRSQERIAAEIAERGRQLERQREQTAELAVEVERTRLASDLDAVARVRVREIVELAASAEPAVGRDPARDRETFGRIERIGRESLNELRGLLGVLRSDERAELAPRPTLAEIETLLAEARAGGRLVQLAVEGVRRPLPDGVELAAYRALQHALVAVHGADGSPATVALRYLPDALELEVRGLTVEGNVVRAALAAARARVGAHGGTFRTETDARQRVLHVHLPSVVADA
jgi:signal transduction histidine kinase